MKSFFCVCAGVTGADVDAVVYSACLKIAMLLVTLMICPAFSIRHFIFRLTFSLVSHFFFIRHVCVANVSAFLFYRSNANIRITIALVINAPIKET